MRLGKIVLSFAAPAILWMILGGPSIDEIWPIKGAAIFVIVAWASVMLVDKIMGLARTDRATYGFVINVIFYISLSGVLIANCIGMLLYLRGFNFGGFVQSWLWLGLCWFVYLKVLLVPILTTTDVEPLEVRRDRPISAPIAMDDRVSDIAERK